MSKNELTPKFSMSYADLSAISKQKVDTMLRDIVEFEALGIDQGEVNEFFEEVRSLDQLKTDDFFRGEVTDAVIVRNELRMKIEHEIRVFVALVKRVYKPSSPIFTKMRVGRLSQLNNNQLFRTGESLHSSLVSVLPELAECGINAEMLDSFYALLQDYSQKITAVNNAINERNSFTNKRIELANSIYKKLMIYCQIGQVIWEDSNEALYNDYFVASSSYKTPDNAPPESSEGGNELPNG